MGAAGADDSKRLVETIRAYAAGSGYDSNGVIMVSPEGDRFLRISGQGRFAREFREAWETRHIPLGLLSWRWDGRTLEAESTLLPWNEGNATLEALFLRLSERCADQIREVLEKKTT